MVGSGPAMLPPTVPYRQLAPRSSQPAVRLYNVQDFGESGAVRDISWSSARILENPGFSVAVRENPWRSGIILATNYLGGIRGKSAPVCVTDGSVPPCCRQRYHFVGANGLAVGYCAKIPAKADIDTTGR